MRAHDHEHFNTGNSSELTSSPPVAKTAGAAISVDADCGRLQGMVTKFEQ